MALVIRHADLPPDLPRLARALSHRPGVQVLWSADGTGPSFVCCEPTEEVIAFDPEPGLPLCAELGPAGAFPRWVGVLPYECRRELERARYSRREKRPAPPIALPVWRRYGAIARVDSEVMLVGDSEASVARLEQLLSCQGSPRPVSLTRVADQADSAADHLARIRAALELIQRGELYQVNLARRFSFRAQGGAVELMLAAAAHGNAPYASALSLGAFEAVSLSPELFLRLEPDRQLTTIPIKGTQPRSADPVEDAALARKLDLDPKERAELAMILDVERNDLGRVAVTGSVRLSAPPSVVSHPTVHHRQATLKAELRPEVSRSALLQAMLPSGSVTGAPKVRAMETIAALEPVRRGLYTGAYGYVSHDGGLQLAMAIRTLSLQGEFGYYHTGGGIVADSDPERELAETEWKALQFSALAAAGQGLGAATAARRS